MREKNLENYTQDLEIELMSGVDYFKSDLEKIFKKYPGSKQIYLSFVFILTTIDDAKIFNEEQKFVVRSVFQSAIKLYFYDNKIDDLYAEMDKIYKFLNDKEKIKKQIREIILLAETEALKNSTGIH